jgi:hypothetical protein
MGPPLIFILADIGGFEGVIDREQQSEMAALSTF